MWSNELASSSISTKREPGTGAAGPPAVTLAALRRSRDSGADAATATATASAAAPSTAAAAQPRSRSEAHRTSSSTSTSDWFTQTFHPTPATVANPARRWSRSTPAYRSTRPASAPVR